MKLLFFFIASLCFSICARSQGVQFRKDTSWETILSDAQKLSKLIFVDVYADWCGPCQKMNKEVFPLKKIGKRFNSDFINYQLNAEKGEGPALKNKYHVTSYPTYLFVRGDGTLIYKARGAMSPQKLLKEGGNALAEAKEPVTIVQMDSLYPLHKKDKGFMYAYVRRRTLLALENANFLDDYFNLLNEKEQGELKNLQLVVDNVSFLSRSLQIGPAFYALLRNKDKFHLLKTNIYNDNLKSIIDIAKEKTLAEAIGKKSEGLLQEALKFNDNSDVFNNNDVVKLHYFWGTKQYKKYFNEAMRYVNDRLMIFSDSTLDSMDSQEYDKVISSVDSSLAKRTNLTKKAKEETRYSYRRTQTIQVTNMLYSICQNILRITTDKDTLQQCFPWISRCIHLAERDTVYFRNVYPLYLDTYARYLYQVGKKAEGISWERQVVNLLKNYPENNFTKEAAERLKKMSNNEKL